MRVTLSDNAPHTDSPENNGYAVVPRSVLTDTRLSDRAVRVYSILDARTTGRAVYVRVDTLAADLGVSPRTVERSLAELVALGYVVRERTRGVARTALLNPVRREARQPRPDRFVAPDPTDLSDTTRNNSLRSKTKIKGSRSQSREPVPVDAAATPLDPSAAYVEAIAQATGQPLKATNAVRSLVLKIAARGMTPQEAGEAAASRLLIAQGLRAVYSPVGFLARTVLTDLAEGAPVPAEATPRPTPIPPPFAEVVPTARPASASERAAALDARADAAERGVAACRAALSRELDAVAPDPFDAFLAQEAAQPSRGSSLTA